VSDCCHGVCCGLDELDPIKVNIDCLYKDYELNLDEAITHALEVYEKNSDNKCGLQHKQLSDWLTELKIQRTRKPEIDTAETLARKVAIFLNSSNNYSLKQFIENFKNEHPVIQSKLTALFSVWVEEHSKMNESDFRINSSVRFAKEVQKLKGDLL